MSSDSDSDNCQLYTKSAENIAVKRKQLQAKREEFEKMLNSISDEDITNISSKFENKLDDSIVINTVGSKNSDVNSSTDSEDNISLAELSYSLRNNKRRRSRVTRSKKTQHLTRNLSDSSDQNEVNSPSANLTIPGNMITNVIVLDDDTGFPTDCPPIDFNSRSKSKCLLNDSKTISIISDSDDDESFSDIMVTISIEWHNGKGLSRKEFKLKRYQKFEKIYNELAEMEGITTNRVVLMHDYSSVKPTDTPSSLKMKYYGLMTGAISKSEVNHCHTGQVEDLNEGKLSVKLQFETHEPLTVAIANNEKMNSLYEICAEELKCPESKIKIIFDGELVDRDERPSDLDLEGGELFHVYIKK